MLEEIGHQGSGLALGVRCLLSFVPKLEVPAGLCATKPIFLGIILQVL